MLCRVFEILPISVLRLEGEIQEVTQCPINLLQSHEDACQLLQHGFPRLILSFLSRGLIVVESSQHIQKRLSSLLPFGV